MVKLACFLSKIHAWLWVFVLIWIKYQWEIYLILVLLLVYIYIYSHNVVSYIQEHMIPKYTRQINWALVFITFNKWRLDIYVLKFTK